MPKGGPSAMTDGPASPPSPSSVIEVSDDDSDDEVIEILDDGDDDPPVKTSTADDCRMIVSRDGTAIQVVQLATFTATDDGQNILVVGDLDVKLPSHLCEVQQAAKPAASSSRISHISGTMVPGSSGITSSSSKSYSSLCGSISNKSLPSSVDGSSSSMSLYSSVRCSSSSNSVHSSFDGSSSSVSVHSSAASNHSQPSVLGTAKGSLLKSYLASENPQVGIAYREQVPRVAQQIDNEVSCFIFFVGHLLKYE
jgi:hypothetical protein